MFKLKFSHVKMTECRKFVVLNVFVFKIVTALDRIEQYYSFSLPTSDSLNWNLLDLLLVSVV
jgi:hypothetical protein